MRTHTDHNISFIYSSITPTHQKRLYSMYAQEESCHAHAHINVENERERRFIRYLTHDGSMLSGNGRAEFG